jgi:hypothetical protein
MASSPPGRRPSSSALDEPRRRGIGSGCVVTAGTDHWHSLRDTAIARLVRSGVDVYFVSKLAGPGNAGFTLSRYGGVLDGEEQADVAKAALEVAFGRLL